jgi:hypothetical protein
METIITTTETTSTSDNYDSGSSGSSDSSGNNEENNSKQKTLLNLHEVPVNENIPKKLRFPVIGIYTDKLAKEQQFKINVNGKDITRSYATTFDGDKKLFKIHFFDNTQLISPKIYTRYKSLNNTLMFNKVNGDIFLNVFPFNSEQKFFFECEQEKNSNFYDTKFKLFIYVKHVQLNEDNVLVVSNDNMELLYTDEVRILVGLENMKKRLIKDKLLSNE